MSAHACREYDPDCFRCDLNLDELDEGQLRESLRDARAALKRERELADRLAAPAKQWLEEECLGPGCNQPKHDEARAALTAWREARAGEREGRDG